jgi:hypothetical protein
VVPKYQKMISLFFLSADMGTISYVVLPNGNVYDSSLNAIDIWKSGVDNIEIQDTVQSFDNRIKKTISHFRNHGFSKEEKWSGTINKYSVRVLKNQRAQNMSFSDEAIHVGK